MGPLQAMMHAIAADHDAIRLILCGENVQVFGDCIPVLVVHVASGFVTHPTMNAAATAEHPQNMLEVKVLCRMRYKFKLLDNVALDAVYGDW